MAHKKHVIPAKAGIQSTSCVSSDMIHVTRRRASGSPLGGGDDEVINGQS